jgi:hypothetical protein
VWLQVRGGAERATLSLLAHPLAGVRRASLALLEQLVSQVSH